MSFDGTIVYMIAIAELCMKYTYIIAEMNFILLGTPDRNRTDIIGSGNQRSIR